MNYVGKFDATISSDGPGAHSPSYVHVDHLPAHAPADAILVPDAQLLFNGDFKRSGVDLILSKDDREFVLHDYFKGEKRAALASPDGAHLTGDIVNALTGEVQYSQAGGPTNDHQVIGHVSKLQGSATAIRNGVSIILNNGDNVEKGDVVQSGSDSTLGVTFIDGTVFGLSSNARMVLNEMVYDPNGSNNSSLLSLVAGTITFVAGETAKHGDMKIDTPVATMGIRGTAVLVEIDFTVPGQGGTPDAKFQVLVEPDGTTGSYILFDKTTLQPIAMVNLAGQQINISNGVISQSSTPLSPDVQKLITDVFSLKFSDANTNTKTTTAQTDTLNPELVGPVFKLADGTTATPIFLVTNPGGGNGPSVPNPNGGLTLQHIDGPPKVVVVDASGHPATGFGLTELPGKTGDTTDQDTVIGKVNFVDINPGDTPTVKVDFSSFVYQNAQHQNLTLNALQQQDIAATEIKLVVVPDPGNNNNGNATWTYSIPDNAFDFLAAGETLTLTYNVRVDNNYTQLDEFTIIPITITITGTNDAPVITSSAPTIAFAGGTNVSGGNLPLLDPDPVTGTKDATSGTLSFKDVDLTDTHTVSAALTGAVGVLNGVTVLNGIDELPPGPFDLLKAALTASIGTDSTGTGVGTINWNLANLPVYIADFIPTGEKLTLTYTVTLTDSQGATTTQDVTVTIGGTNAPAVVWIDTTASPSGGQWNVGTNWETGTVPTATEDVIIITDQLIGLTPVYPVTIDSDIAAVANSLTMNDFGPLFTNSPKLVNQGTLTVGLGGVSLKADSIIENDKLATISVAGLMEVLEQSSLQNYGQITLQGGGDFKDQSTITNFAFGTIEVSGGTLNVLVDVANSGQITVDADATMALDAGTVDGGTVSISGTLELEGAGILKNGSLDNSGQVKVSGIGNALDGETVIANSALEIMAGGALLIDQGSSITNGKLTVDGTATLTLNDATITSGTVTNEASGTIDLTGGAALKSGSLGNSGQINVSGIDNALDGETVTANLAMAILSGGALTIDQGSKVANGGGAVTVDGGGTLTLNDATITSGAVTNETNGTIDLTGSAVLTGGSLGNSGQINVSGNGNALDGETVTANLAIEILSGGALTIDQGSKVAIGGGTVTVDGSGTLTLNDATITSGTVTNETNGTIDFTGAGVLKSGSLGNSGQINVGGTGNALDGETVAANLAIEILSGGALTIDQGSTVANSDGTIKVDGSGTLTLNDATITSGAVTNEASGTIDLTGGAAPKSGSLGNSGQINVSGSGNALDGETVTANLAIEILSGGALTIDKGSTVANSAGTIKVDGSATLTLNDATITSGTVTNETNGTIDLTGGVVLTGGSLGNSGQINVSGNGNAMDGETVTANLAIEILSGGALTIDQGSKVANGGGTVTVDGSGTLTLNDATITSGTVTNETNGTIDLTGSAVLTGGTLGNSGQINVSGTANALDGETVTNGEAGAIDITGVLTLDLGTSIAGGKLTNFGTLFIENPGATLDGVNVDNTSGTIYVDAETPTPALATLKLKDGTTISNGTLTIGIVGILEISTSLGATLSGVNAGDSGTIQVDAGSMLTLDGTTITGSALTNYGSVFIETAIGSTLDGVSVDNTSGKIEVDTGNGNPSPTTILTLDDGTTITNGTLTIGTVGILDVSKSLGATLFGVSVGNFGTVQVDAESVLTLDGTTITGGMVTDYGTVKVDSHDTLKLNGVALSGGSISNAGTVEITGSGSIDNDSFVNTHATLLVDANTTLTLDGTTIIGGTVADHGAINVDGGDTLTLIGTTIAGGELTVAGILDSIGISAIDDTTITNTGTIEATNDTLTIDPDQPFTLINSGTLEADGGELDITGELVTNTGLLQAVDHGTLKLTATLVANSATVSDTDGSTIDLVDAAISGGGLKIAGTFDSAGISALNGVAITNSGTFEVTSGKLIIDSASSVSNTAGGTLEANGGALIINGSLSGNAEIVGGSFLELGDAASGAYSAATVAFAAGSTGTLKLDHAESFSGTVAGLDDNTLDLGDIAYGSHPTFVYAGNTSGGTLEVFVKGVDVANVKLSGDYLGSSWSATSDGSGGTDINEVPGALSGLDSHGDADQGVKLTASITDGGEPVTNATYTFETSADGKHWTTVQSGTNSSYTPADRDEGKQLQVVLSFTDSSGHHETSTVSAGTVQDNPNDHPTILGETDPATQTIILDESPMVLASGVSTNLLGLPTETFNDVSAGSSSNNGFGHGSFTSSALDATFSSSGDAGVVDGSSSVSAPPFIGPSPGQVDNTHYLSIGAGGTETISFATEQNQFGLYWGSVDPSNTIDFYNGTKLVASYTGADISPLLASGGQGSFASNGYVEFSDLVPFNKVVLSNGNANAFEIDNISAGDSHIHLAPPITGTLTVSDDDIGDTLTASVTGDAVIKYNGSTSLPSGINVDALINPDAVTFDSVKADGGADVLHWTYNPTNPDLDFLKPGDTLTITFAAQVSDGHATAGDQPLTITLVGTGSSIVNGTPQNDTFAHVGGGVTIFGNGGNDTFVFNPNFGSATIGDFDLRNDTIDIDRTLFSNVAAILASAQPANSGHDTIITDAAHDKIVLTGVTVSQLNAHQNDFHLV